VFHKVTIAAKRTNRAEFMKSFRRLPGILLICGLATGCAQPHGDLLVEDPLEEFNRTMHGFNKGMDTVVVRPAADVFDLVTPKVVRFVFANAVDHLKLPGVFVNFVLQGETDGALRTLGRFTVNTVGGAGFLDPATEAGLPRIDTDFGLTLASWGVGEGVYIELPIFGPSTARDAVGRVVDTALQPTTYVSGGTDATIASAAVRALEIVDARDRHAALIDDLLYRSEDSYISVRANYIQNRRRRAAGGKTDVDALPDMFTN